MPITGEMPIHIPTLMKVWNASAEATPKQMSIPKGEPERTPMTQQRIMITVSRTMMIMQAIMPISSPMEAKIQSVCLALKLPWANRPLPLPTPVRRPEARASLVLCVCHVMPVPEGSMISGMYGASILFF